MRRGTGDHVDPGRRRFLARAAAMAAAARLGIVGAALNEVGCMARAAVADAELASLDGATGWINTAPLTASALRGKVVAVDFCTYTCINWLRTLPYVRAWAETYGDKGLVVIGAHTPEFMFERDVDNVRDAVTAMRITYPVAIDNDQAIWNGFGNGYWPALYLVDATGRIRYHHFGEGDYADAERTIQKLLAEAGRREVGTGLVAVSPSGVEVAADWDDLASPENYLGYARSAGFASPGGVLPDERRSYAPSPRLARNQWALSGEWTIRPQRITLDVGGGRIAYRFHARDLHVVMGPETRGATVRFRVTLDGQPPGSAHGADVDEGGAGTVRDQRLYQLIRQRPPIADRQFEIEFLDPAVQALAFTFG